MKPKVFLYTLLICLFFCSENFAYYGRYGHPHYVRVLPRGCVSVYLGGVPYYHYRDTYYQRLGTQYVIVTPPPTPMTIQSSSDDQTFTLQILNSKGGYTPVAIQRSGQGFVGPQGEYYAVFPKVSQLKVMYVD